MFDPRQGSNNSTINHNTTAANSNSSSPAPSLIQPITNLSSPSSSPSSSIRSADRPTVQHPQLWMGELDQRWDEVTIRQLWASLLAPIGITIHSVKLIRDHQSSQMGLSNAGYCFVRFYGFEDASKVLSLFNGKPIPGTAGQRFFRLNWSSANVQAAAAVAQKLPESSAVEYSIFVGDLPQGITEHLLFEAFKSRYPSCSGAKVMVDQNTGHIRGFGFVKFLNDVEMRRALVEMQGFVLLGRPIRVSPATKSARDERRSLQQQQQQQQQQQNQSQIQSQQLQIHHHHNQHQPQPLEKQPSPSYIAGPPVPASSSIQCYNDPSNTTIFIGGLNVPISESELRELFSKFGDITYVKIPAGKNCGFVQFFHRASAETALTEMQGYNIGGGCRIRVSWGARAAQRIWFARQLQQEQRQQAQASIQPIQPRQTPQLYGYSGQPQYGYPAANLGLNSVNRRVPLVTTPQLSPSQSTTDKQLKLNSLLLAARDGNLDRLDINSSLYGPTDNNGQ